MLKHVEIKIKKINPNSSKEEVIEAYNEREKLLARLYRANDTLGTQVDRLLIQEKKSIALIYVLLAVVGYFGVSALFR